MPERRRKFERRIAFVAVMPLALSVSLFVAVDLARAAEKAAPAERNPPGDIPDTQVFIDFSSPAGFLLKVPEGWARSDQSSGSTFVDKLDGVIVSTEPENSAPTVEMVRSDYLARLASAERAVKVTSVEYAKLPAGRAVRVVYTSNSEPNDVTGKQVRLENERFLFFKDGKLVTVEFYAPKGADNADQWQLMSKSFRWN
ncbi:hypothetical protein [Rhizobium sp. RAF56]|uniref:hypothetical protein n=1 Tax=Rhizobium sp. RAF56 TaxID=3233062 RepID=UPI003F99294C